MNSKETNPKSFRIYDGPNTKVQLQWEPRDMWVGVFWRRTDVCLHVYICVLPLIPIHITTLRRSHIRTMREKLNS